VYDAAKDGLISSGYMTEGIACNFASAVIAGVTATLAASPVDVIEVPFIVPRLLPVRKDFLPFTKDLQQAV